MFGNLCIQAKSLERLPQHLTSCAFPLVSRGNLIQITTYGDLGAFFAQAGQDIQSILSITKLLNLKKDGLDVNNLSHTAQTAGLDVSKSQIKHLLTKTVAELELQLQKMQTIQVIFDLTETKASRTEKAQAEAEAYYKNNPDIHFTRAFEALLS